MKSRRSWEDHRFEEVFKVVKSSREEINIRKSNIGDSDNTGDRGKIVGGAIRACGGIGTDITNNTRKRPKLDKHRHENGKECTRAEDLIAEVSSKKGKMQLTWPNKDSSAMCHLSKEIVTRKLLIGPSQQRRITGLLRYTPS
ncbi:hypothetical protein Tco_1479242 [Tanacetum coccineum]